MGIEFYKGHGTGNDFIIIPDDDGVLDISATDVARWCRRHHGVGADGILRVVRAGNMGPEASDVAPETWFMDYRNADGSIAEMCGNGARVFAHFLRTTGRQIATDFDIATRAGLKRINVLPNHHYRVAMGSALLRSDEIHVAVADREIGARAVFIPNPHAVARVPDLSMIGPLLEAPIVSPSSVFPDGTNVEFFEQTNPGFITMRVFERGVGETQSCGTGACAAALVAALEYPEITEWNVHVPGGTVTVTLSQDGHIALAGPAELVAHGTLLDGDVEGA